MTTIVCGVIIKKKKKIRAWVVTEFSDTPHPTPHSLADPSQEAVSESVILIGLIYHKEWPLIGT